MIVTVAGTAACGGTISPHGGFYAEGDSQVADKAGKMRFFNQRDTATKRRPRGSEASYGEDPALIDGVDAHVEFYRREAQRLIALAAASPFDDAKRQFLGLAQQYETLAEHAVRRSTRGV